MTSDQIVDLLNEALALDPAAIDSLLCTSIPANKGLMEHKTIQVLTKNKNNDFPVLRVLGLINGIAGIDGDIIEAIYENNCLVRFQIKNI